MACTRVLLVTGCGNRSRRQEEQKDRSHGGERFRDSADGLLGVPDGVVHVWHRTEAAHVDIAVQQQRTQAAGRYQEGNSSGEATTGRKHQQHGDQGQGGLETEQLSLADVWARAAGESVEVRGEATVDVGVDAQPGLPS
jgi:hypothetical protein